MSSKLEDAGRMFDAAKCGDLPVFLDVLNNTKYSKEDFAMVFGSPLAITCIFNRQEWLVYLNPNNCLMEISFDNREIINHDRVMPFIEHAVNNGWDLNQKKLDNSVITSCHFKILYRELWDLIPEFIKILRSCVRMGYTDKAHLLKYVEKRKFASHLNYDEFVRDIEACFGKPKKSAMSSK